MAIKVLFFRSGFVAAHIIDDFLEAFRFLGHETILARPNLIGLEQQLHPNNPHLAVTYDFRFVKTYSYLLRKNKIPIICLHYDNPFYFLDASLKKELLNNPGYYHHFVWDPAYLELLRMRGIKNVYPIQLGVNPRRFFPDDSVKPEGACSFVGSAEPVDLAKAIASVKDAAPYASFMREVISRKINDFTKPMHRLAMTLAKRKSEYRPIHELYKVDPFRYWQLHFQMHKHGSLLLRHHILSQTRSAVHLFGSPAWPSDRHIFHPAVDYNRELASVYRRYAIHINISTLMAEQALNNRPFDAMASKVLVLSDYKDDLKALFPDHWEAVSYSSVNELNEKIEYYLEHPKEREAIAEELYHISATKHTYVERVKYILQTI